MFSQKPGKTGNFIRSFNFPYKLPGPVINLIVEEIELSVGPFDTESALVVTLPFQSIRLLSRICPICQLMMEKYDNFFQSCSLQTYSSLLDEPYVANKN